MNFNYLHSLLPHDAFVRTNRHAIAMMFDRLNVLGTMTPKHVHLLPAIFFQFHLKERWSMDMQTRWRTKR